jgi:hypothetical protein
MHAVLSPKKLLDDDFDTLILKQAAKIKKNEVIILLHFPVSDSTQPCPDLKKEERTTETT